MTTPEDPRALLATWIGWWKSSEFPAYLLPDTLLSRTEETLAYTPPEKPERMHPLLITPEEAARLLSIGRSRLHELLAEKAIPSVTIGRSRRIRTADLERYVEEL